VVSEQNEAVVKEKALRMHRRGVRRIFAVFVRGERRVGEWSADTRSWRILDPTSYIEDPCLEVPLKVAALLDAAAANQAVVEALAAQGDPTIQRREAGAKAKTILLFLEARGIVVSPSQRRSCVVTTSTDWTAGPARPPWPRRQPKSSRSDSSAGSGCILCCRPSSRSSASSATCSPSAREPVESCRLRPCYSPACG